MIFSRNDMKRGDVLFYVTSDARYEGLVIEITDTEVYMLIDRWCQIGSKNFHGIAYSMNLKFAQRHWQYVKP